MLFFYYLIERSDKSIDEQIDKNQYQSSDLVDIKIPVHLNIRDWDDYALVSGQVTIKDTVYNYAELKMTRDTMFLKCIPNHDKALLVNAKVIYGKQVNDVPVNKKSNLTLIKKNFSVNEYIYTCNKLPGIGSCLTTISWHTHACVKMYNIPINFAGQPPDASCLLS